MRVGVVWEGDRRETVTEQTGRGRSQTGVITRAAPIEHGKLICAFCHTCPHASIHPTGRARFRRHHRCL